MGFVVKLDLICCSQFDKSQWRQGPRWCGFSCHKKNEPTCCRSHKPGLQRWLHIRNMESFTFAQSVRGTWCHAWCDDRFKEQLQQRPTQAWSASWFPLVSSASSVSDSGCRDRDKEKCSELLICTVPKGRPGGRALGHSPSLSNRTWQVLRSLVPGRGEKRRHSCHCADRPLVIGLSGFPLKLGCCHHPDDTSSFYLNQVISPPGPAV